MSITAGQVAAAAERWGLGEAAAPVAAQLASYGNLLMAWNARLSLTSIRDEGQMIERHLLEGLFAGLHHPPAATALDFGSGTGIPGVAVAVARPEIRVTLAESQQKKAAFLREVIRILDLHATVHAGRAELLPAASFGAVWMRAVDRSAAMLPLAAGLVAREGRLCLLTSSAGAGAAEDALGPYWVWSSTPIPCSESRLLHIGQRM
jgi:16S rRNA (guanine527-N7)-methyltransferase